MLTIRNSQLAALAAQRTADFEDELVRACCKRLEGRVPGGVPESAVRELAASCMAQCRAQGIVHRHRISRVVATVLADAAFPMTAQAVAAKAQSAIAELRASDLYNRLQALDRAYPGLRHRAAGSPA